MQHLYPLVDSILIPHTAYQEGLNRLTQFVEISKRNLNAICACLLGASGTGKSTLVKQIEFAYPARRHKEGLERPVMVVRVPVAPDIRKFVTVMLKALGDPFWNDRANVTEKTERLIDLMRLCKVRALFLDEAQHFADKDSAILIHDVSNWLKAFIDEMNITVVVVGLPSTSQILEQNEQLARRFDSPIELGRFTWTNHHERNSFRDVLQAYKEAMKPFQLPDLDSEEMAFRFYVATGGIIAYVTKILRQASWDAIAEHRKAICMEDLEVAWNTTIRKSSLKLTNPFSRTFNNLANHENLALAEELVAPVLPPKRRSGIKKPISRITS